MLARNPSALTIGKVPDIEAFSEDHADGVLLEEIRQAIAGRAVARRRQGLRDFPVRLPDLRQFERKDQAISGRDGGPRFDVGLPRLCVECGDP